MPAAHARHASGGARPGAHISPISPVYLPYISQAELGPEPTSPLYLPYTSRLYLPYTSPISISPVYLPYISQAELGPELHRPTGVAWVHMLGAVGRRDMGEIWARDWREIWEI